MKKIIPIIIAFSLAFVTESCSIQNQTSTAASAATATHIHCYMISNYTIKDQATFNKYMEAAGSLAPKYNGKVIIYNEKPTVLEGAPASVIAVAEFKSLAEAERFY